MATKEKKQAAKRIGQAITIIGVIIIPLLYSFFYLEAFWDPYARLDDVPVAIVNMDEGAIINGTERNIGQEVCDNLLEDGTLKFISTTDEDSTDGVLNQKYYASITIPKDFTRCVATASEDTEKLHSKIIYSANQKKNYLASQIIENAMPKIEIKVNSSIDKEIISTLSDQISGVPDQMEELQDGLTQLHNGSVQLNNGTTQLAYGTDNLKAGAKKLNDGTSMLKSNLPTLKSGVIQLADGSTQLAVGSRDLQNGIAQYTNGVSQAQQGSSTLTTGIESYTNGVAQANTGSATLKNGINEYTNGVAQASTGSATLKTGISEYTNGVTQASDGATVLKNGINQYTQGVSSINAGYSTLSNGINTAAQTVNTLSSGTKVIDTTFQQALMLINSNDPVQIAQGKLIMSQLGTKITELSTGLNQLNAGFGSATTSNTILAGDATIKAGLDTLTSKNEELNGGINQLSAGLDTLKSNNDTLNGGAKQLSDGLNLLDSNNETLNNGSKQLSDGLNLLNSNNEALTTGAKQLTNGLNQLTSNSPALNNGVSQLQSGASQLQNGLGTLNSKVPTLENGALQLTNGTTQLYDGAVKLNNGANDLDDGASKLKDGLKTAKTGVDDSVNSTIEKLGVLDGLADYAEAPVSTEVNNIQPVENYGSAFAPYFMCLSLWVGGLMIFFGIYLDYNKKIKSLTKDGKYFRNKCIAFTLISLAQGGALALVIKYALGITVNNDLFLIVSCAAVAMCFMTIIQFLIMALGNAGKFLALFLLILQLTSCAGTFPLETQSEFFQFINKILPMTYATQLFKEAISGTVGSWAWKNFAIIALFWAIALVFGIIARLINKSKTSKSPTPATV